MTPLQGDVAPITIWVIGSGSQGVPAAGGGDSADLAGSLRIVYKGVGVVVGELGDDEVFSVFADGQLVGPRTVDDRGGVPGDPGPAHIEGELVIATFGGAFFDVMDP